MLGEILRWLTINAQALARGLMRRLQRARARVLRRDELVAGSERRFRALLESAPDAMVIVDWHGHIRLVNQQAEHLFGWRREEIVGQNIAELIPERFRSVHRAHQRGYLREAQPRPMG